MENNTVFVLLAGGKSERMGVDKGLLKYQQTFWILEQLTRISKTSISEVYIGLGFNYQYYFNAIPWLEDAVTKSINFQNLHINVVINKYPELGTFSTLQTVLKELESTCNILLSHIDIPILNSEEFQAILKLNNNVVIPNFNGKNGHPIKINAPFLQQLQKIDITHEEARLDVQIKKLNPSEITNVEVFDQVILQNLNTKKDWISFLNRNSNKTKIIKQ